MPGGSVAMCHLEKSAAWATIVLFGVTNIARADSGWSWRNPLPTGAYLSAAAAVDANTATAVGANGTILRTTDGGASWKIQSSGMTSGLWAVSFTDANIGTVVGANGTI